MLDVLITGGEMYDGTGALAFRADVGIAGDRIVLLRRSVPREAEEMADGALGIAPAKLTELCRVAAAYDGCYASHIRSEGEHLHEVLAEFLAIVRDAGLRGEVFHLKAAGQSHWDKMDGAIEMIEKARAAGDPVTAVYEPGRGAS